MRVGVSSRGNSWVSMGPVGWLILGPVILAVYLAAGIVIVLMWAGSQAVTAVQAHNARHV